jgi:hypothetical protein
MHLYFHKHYDSLEGVCDDVQSPSGVDSEEEEERHAAPMGEVLNMTVSAPFWNPLADNPEQGRWFVNLVGKVATRQLAFIPAYFATLELKLSGASSSFIDALCDTKIFSYMVLTEHRHGDLERRSQGYPLYSSWVVPSPVHVNWPRTPCRTYCLSRRRSAC